MYRLMDILLLQSMSIRLHQEVGPKHPEPSRRDDKNCGPAVLGERKDVLSHSEG